MILYDFGRVKRLLRRDHLQDRPNCLSTKCGQKLLKEGRGGGTSTSTFYGASGAKETVSQRVTALTKEIKDMRQIHTEI
ncbi:hypothetical protein M5K25_009545 [Dendrobium thyrsiflorum]|uniref:Uncharacterized protein n=1 Tax=Dendrobium thyrsiflorum TaxID=117978 RepID=A0ABD0V628_DENTH